MTLDGTSTVSVTRVLADGTEEPGGTAQLFVLGDEWSITDFSDPDGNPWPLPPGARFDIEFILPEPPPGSTLVESPGFPRERRRDRWLWRWRRWLW